MAESMFTQALRHIFISLILPTHSYGHGFVACQQLPGDMFVLFLSVPWSDGPGNPKVRALLHNIGQNPTKASSMRPIKLNQR